ncbi:sulfatase family protein [Calycomorphotria hydatis]|uniref:Arylsulfatase n=1 Tax=Calycomorphotria hydatis TaxID=2528027 RepID=A0A517T683_9PLAN|nr:arylsulfatase [Calycomorphotria hydatis]QDT63883.1 Arylsulfatase [Calycomorphotria hydatis]
MRHASLVIAISAITVSGLAWAEETPNIIIILADDLGYHDLECYGQDIFPTPHTSRLASEGMRFTDAHSPSAVCSPTRYGLLTGTSPFRRYHTSHVLFNGEPLVIGENEPTIASLLKECGYATGVNGKWHLGLGNHVPRDLNQPGRGPQSIGFEESFLVPDGHNMFPRYYMKNGEVLGGVVPPFESSPQLIDRLGYKLVDHQQIGNWPDRRPDEEISQSLEKAAIAFIKRHQSEKFFLYFPTCSIHFPITPGAEYQGKSGIGPYGDFVMEFDGTVGKVMKTLEELHLEENTLLIVTSDNGGYAKSGNSGHRPTSPWRGAKDSSWEGGHRVPMIVRWSQKIPRATVCDQLISLLDLTATCVALAESQLPEDAALDSFDFSPVFEGHTNVTPIRSSLLAGKRGMVTLSIRQDHWKLIKNTQTGHTELYNLKADPGESKNLATTNPQKTNQLARMLEEYFTAGATRATAKSAGKPLREIFKEKATRNRELLPRPLLPSPQPNDQ